MEFEGPVPALEAAEKLRTFLVRNVCSDVHSGMRSADETQDDLFCTKTLEEMVPENHRLRKLRPLVDEAMKPLRPKLARLYSDTGDRALPRNGCCALC